METGGGSDRLTQCIKDLPRDGLSPPGGLNVTPQAFPGQLLLFRALLREDALQICHHLRHHHLGLLDHALLHHARLLRILNGVAQQGHNTTIGQHLLHLSRALRYLGLLLRRHGLLHAAVEQTLLVVGQFQLLEQSLQSLLAPLNLGDFGSSSPGLGHGRPHQLHILRCDGLVHGPHSLLAAKSAPQIDESVLRNPQLRRLHPGHGRISQGPFQGCDLLRQGLRHWRCCCILCGALQKSLAEALRGGLPTSKLLEKKLQTPFGDCETTCLDTRLLGTAYCLLQIVDVLPGASDIQDLLGRCAILLIDDLVEHARRLGKVLLGKEAASTRLAQALLELLPRATIHSGSERRRRRLSHQAVPFLLLPTQALPLGLL
mmetsp:Transcript_115269/g.257564  ORF Transcript_115269/g.257564 Transcript_115269/m.257564 type:complete len:374 (-) Transcript_115269:108-1229(-)